MGMHLRGFLLTLTACLGLSAGDVRAGMVTNFGQPEAAGHTQVHATHWVAQGFTLDGFNYNLSKVTLWLKDATNSSGGFFLQIRDAAGSAPGNTVLTTLSGSANPSSAGSYEYTGNVFLSANQSYFVVAGVTSGNGNYSWRGTPSDDQTGDLNWNIGRRGDFAGVARRRSISCAIAARPARLQCRPFT
jgi:hypothetical protein